MRKILAIVLLLVLGLPSALPLFAAVRGDADSGLPACCRRMGRHHCAMDGTAVAAAGMARSADARTGARADDGTGAVKVMRAAGEICPYRCAMMTAAHAGPVLLLRAPLRLDAAVVAHPAVVAQTESRWRVARERARGKRGPPTAASQRVS